MSRAAIDGCGDQRWRVWSLAPGPPGWLGLAAAPTFGAMALATGLLVGGAGMCSAAHASVLGGMAPMYGLMAVFHTPPWLKLVASRIEAVRNRRR